MTGPDDPEASTSNQVRSEAPPFTVVVQGRKWWQDLLLGMGIAVLGGFVVGLMLIYATDKIDRDRAVRKAELDAALQDRETQDINAELRLRIGYLTAALTDLGCYPDSNGVETNIGKYGKMIDALRTFYDPPRPLAPDLKGRSTGQLVERLFDLHNGDEELRACELAISQIPSLLMSPWEGTEDYIGLAYDTREHCYVLVGNRDIEPLHSDRVRFWQYLSFILLPRWTEKVTENLEIHPDQPKGTRNRRN